MDNSNTELIKAVVHYQQCLEKYTRRDNEPRMLYCIGKLYKLPITVEHLEETGVGRTVNSLRKFSGEVGEAAKKLVAKWKEMVVGEDNDPKDSSDKPESVKSHKEESKNRKHKEGSSSSSHRESDKKTKQECKERNSSSFSNGEESHSKKVKEESKHKKSEESYKKDKESNHYKHKSSKRKQSSDNSESDDNDYEKGKSSNHKHKSPHKSSRRQQDSDNSESDDYEYEKMKSNSQKHKSSKQKAEETESEDESHYKVEKDKKERLKEKSSKRKHEDSDYDDEEYEEVNIKHKKYSEDEEWESEIEEKEVKTLSHKYQSKHKDESNNVAKEKNKHSSHKHKDKKEKKEHLPENKPKKYDDEYKLKDKQSSKEKAKSSSEKKEKEENSKKSKQGSSKHHSDKEHKSPKKSSSHSGKGKVTVHENGIGSDSGTSFADALGMLEPPSSSKTNKKKIAVIHPFPVEKPTYFSSSSPDISKTETVDLLSQKKLEPLDINISNLLPEITPNYRPIGNFLLDNGQSKNKVTAEEEALSAIMYSKISRTKVYSGNKVLYGTVPSLFDLCTHVLQDNIDALEYTGGVPYIILKPVIERANPDQLFTLEHHNPYLIEDTDELWQLHCQKQFRTKRREEMETWRDMYMRCLDEREAKLKALTFNIKQSQDKSLPVRQTKLAYVDGHSIVKPPRSIARKQAKHGTAGVEKRPLVTPSSRLSALATSGAAGQIAVPNPGSRAATAAGSSSAAMKPKKAPLMQKTLAFMKNRLFRR